MMAERSLDALIVTSLPNILYLTNFTGSSAIVVLTAARLLFVTDFRYVTAIADSRGTPHECPGMELITVASSYDATLVEALAKMPAARVGFEAANLSVARHDWLEATIGKGRAAPTLVSSEGLVEAARIVKDEYEMSLLREAARRLSDVSAVVGSEVQRGRTELEVALAIDWRIRRAGFEKVAFDTIVAGGPNAALPHAHPGRAKIGRRRPRGAGLWRRLRLILRRPDADRFGRFGVGAGASSVRGRAQGARPRDCGGQAGRVAV